jgi:DNA ligase D-like protein (predicted 3'-phosphoesterase)
MTKNKSDSDDKKSSKSSKRGLDDYHARRDFARTSEPAGGKPSGEYPQFVVQKHDATRLHYDFRLEIDGVLASWAVPKGPSMDPADKRLAMPTEDHPMDYLHFEGVIPEGEYGAGPVIVWDTGPFVNIRDVSMSEAMEQGQVEVFLQGKKLSGAFVVVKSGRDKSGRDRWLLIKMKDEHARKGGGDIVQTAPESVVTGRTIEQVKEEG